MASFTAAMIPRHAHHFRGVTSISVGTGRMLGASNDSILRRNICCTPSISSQGAFHPHGKQFHPHHHSRSIFSSSYRMEILQRTFHTPPSNYFSTFTRSEYIHPLSQIVLEHLQSRHSQWVTNMGLDTGLKLNKDGTFVLRFPSLDDEGVAAQDDEGAVEGDSVEDTARNNTDGSIWTMYEPTEKKHYLCVTKGSLVGRYMLQDNTKPAWHSDKRSTPERVQDAVDGMIEKMQTGYLR